jgi:hypothetical protein
MASQIKQRELHKMKKKLGHDGKGYAYKNVPTTDFEWIAQLIRRAATFEAGSITGNLRVVELSHYEGIVEQYNNAGRMKEANGFGKHTSIELDPMFVKYMANSEKADNMKEGEEDWKKGVIYYIVESYGFPICFRLIEHDENGMAVTRTKIIETQKGLSMTTKKHINGLKRGIYADELNHIEETQRLFG